MVAMLYFLVNRENIAVENVRMELVITSFRTMRPRSFED